MRTPKRLAAHEAMPGHWLHAVHMRQTPGKIRRIWIGLNPFPQPSSGQDGWAHYAEELVVEHGFMNGDPRYELAHAHAAPRYKSGIGRKLQSPRFPRTRHEERHRADLGAPAAAAAG